jgi:hypothetical protein
MPISKLTSLPFPPPAVPPFSASGQGLVASVNQLIDTSVASLKSLPTSPQTDTVYNVIGFYANGDTGGGKFIYVPSMSKTLHNGGTVITLEAVAAWSGLQSDLPTFLNWTGSGSGCYVRLDVDGMYDVTWFGAIGDYLNFDDSNAAQAAINTIQENPAYNVDNTKIGYGGIVFFPPGRYHVQSLVVSKFNIQVEGIAGASFLVNKSTTLDVLTAAWDGGSSTIGGLAFVDIEVINIVDRADGAPPLVTLDKAVRSEFRRFRLTSSDFTTGAQVSKKGDGIKLIAPFEVIGDIEVYGFTGIGMDVISGPQSDSFELQGLFRYNSVGLVGFRGAGGSGNNNFKFGGKFLGSQGGFYVSTGQDSYGETTVVSTAGNVLTVASSTNMQVGRAVVVGRTNTMQIAIIRSISGNDLTLDRPITLSAGEIVVSGRFGCITSEMRNPSFSGIQFEGCDVGLYTTKGTTRVTVQDYVFSSCSKAAILNCQFRKAVFQNGVAAASGTLRNGVTWKFITLLDIEDRFSYLYLLDNPAEGSAYYSGTRASLVDNRSGFFPFQRMDNRTEGTVFDAKNSQPAITFEDNTYLTFSRTATNKFCRASWKEGVTDKWFLDFTRTNGDLEFRKSGETIASISFSGATGVPTLGDGAWDGLPSKIGSQYVWIDTNLKVRSKNGVPTSDLDGEILGDYESEWDSPSKLKLGVYRFWLDSSGRLRTKSSEPTSDTDGVIIGAQS